MSAPPLNRTPNGQKADGRPSPDSLDYLDNLPNSDLSEQEIDVRSAAVDSSSRKSSTRYPEGDVGDTTISVSDAPENTPTENISYVYKLPEIPTTVLTPENITYIYDTPRFRLPYYVVNDTRPESGKRRGRPDKHKTSSGTPPGKQSDIFVINKI